MGRTSKFSFPIPGRTKHTSTKETPPAKPRTQSQNLSKAQRILGTDDLNVDYTPTKEDEPSWRYSSSRSSRMSISISESTQSTNETGSTKGTQYGQWEHESGLSRNQHLHGKASSTLLGQPYGDDGTTMGSSASRRLRHEDSSSTLRSHYDRQKSPLSISQQTSASSARDLALRKGFPPVIQRSPLLQVEASIDPFDTQFTTGSRDPKRATGRSSDSESRKKPAKLDLSMLFPRSRKHGGKSSDSESLALSPSSISTNVSRAPSITGRRKLAKSRSKESLKSQKHSIRSTESHDPAHRHPNGATHQLYDHYEQMPVRSPRMDRIPESRVPSRNASRQMGDNHNERSHLSSKPAQEGEIRSTSAEREPFSWKNVRSSMISERGRNEASSIASISSRNTKTSRHTSGSGISNSDLKLKSVLSLSSDSEGDLSDPGAVRAINMSSNSRASRLLNGSSSGRKDDRPTSTYKSEGLSPRTQSSRRAPPSRVNNFLSVPGTSYAHTPLSPPYSSSKTEISKSPSHSKETRQQSQKDKRSSRHTPSVLSARSSLQPTPPLSPTSVEFRETSEETSRFMAVTKQEEALLEALRLKRARMREKIIEEHEIAKSPPRIPDKDTSRYSETSSVGTVRGVPGERQRILLYLDTPVSESQHIDMAEPSPDLSDFLSFGSDEESTPRGSWVGPSKGQPRPDSAVSPRMRNKKASPMTPPSAARLSAVGAIGGFRNDRAEGGGAKKRGTGVRFVDDSKLVNAQDFLMDENEADELWDL
ncbi:hypothetical protein G7Y89_g9581 [Cudoniella acicularis]|uniref:Uncharacterized protein n=1 Tax=Cudoniella acicularis TaxID=354080 RepID=A0A8H4VZH9_9HELO|nr:hypothetical protein G7Y89_g9581 [Cudoniella acicularis]